MVGKGDTPRPYVPDKFGAGYENIDWSKRYESEPKNVVTTKSTLNCYCGRVFAINRNTQIPFTCDQCGSEVVILK